MERTVSATEARVRFGEMIRRVAEEGEIIIVERAGGPQVVVLSIEEYRKLRAHQVEDPRWAGFRQAIAVAQEFQRSLVAQELPLAEDVIRAGREERGAEVQDAAGRPR